MLLSLSLSPFLDLEDPYTVLDSVFIPFANREPSKLLFSPLFVSLVKVRRFCQEAPL